MLSAHFGAEGFLLLALILLLLIQLAFTTGLARALAQLPTLPQFPNGFSGESTLHATVVIPAFNEQENIERCVRSALQAFCEASVTGSVVVVDDRSTDSTPEILARLAFEFPRHLKILKSEDPPDAMAFHGKNRACWSARNHLEGTHVLFLDADVRLGKTALPDALRYAESEKVDLLSLAPALAFGCLAEWIVQPIMMMFMGALFRATEVNDPTSSHAFAAGPFLLFRREFYESLGGHTAVAHEIVEDVAFARLVKEKGGRLRLLSGAHVASLRMYSSLSALWEGWTKNIYIGLERSPVRAAAAIVVLALLFVMPFAAFLGTLGFVWSASGTEASPDVSHLGLAMASVLLIFVARGFVWWKLRVPFGLVWATPVGAILVMMLVVDSAWRVTTQRGWTWKGRSLS
jgi:cellulose synthase/poly-beta-1,6-N-acetylglucosamine synthase-like glycosyltransferase